MSYDAPPQRFPIVPLITFLTTLALIIMLMFKSMQSKPDRYGDEPVPTRRQEQTDDRQDPDDETVALDDGQEFDRDAALREGVRLVEADELSSPRQQEGVKMALQRDQVYDSLLKWNVVGKVEDKNWGLRKLINMVYISEAAVVQTVEENDGSTIVVVYDFKSIKSFKALYELESIKLDFMEGSPEKIRTASMILAPLFDMIVPGSGMKIQLSGAVLSFKAKPVLENLTLQGYKLVFDPAKANDQVKIFGQVNSLEGKKVRITHRKGAVAKIVPIGCKLTASERNFCMNLGVLANYHLMPETDKKVGGTWNVKASHFANLLEPTLRGVPGGLVEVELKERNRKDGVEQATLEIVKGTIELDSSDPKMSRLGKCTPKGTLIYDVKERYVTRAGLTADISLERTSRKHLLFETRFKSNPSVVIDYQCSKNSVQDKEISRFPELEKEKLQPIPVEFLAPFDWK